MTAPAHLTVCGRKLLPRVPDCYEWYSADARNELVVWRSGRVWIGRADLAVTVGIVVTTMGTAKSARAGALALARLLRRWNLVRFVRPTSHARSAMGARP